MEVYEQSINFRNSLVKALWDFKGLEKEMPGRDEIDRHVYFHTLVYKYVCSEMGYMEQNMDQIPHKALGMSLYIFVFVP